jgi:FMNH2-dependent dimethyl sulfone monooxygenase
MHGDPPERIRAKIADMRERRERFGLPPMQYGMAGFTIVRDTEREARAELARITNVKSSAAGYDNYQQWLSGTKLEGQMSIDEYSVTNRGLRPGFVGTSEQISQRIEQFADAGLDLLLLQCSPQLEEMERFASEVIRKQPVKNSD